MEEGRNVGGGDDFMIKYMRRRSRAGEKIDEDRKQKKKAG